MVLKALNSKIKIGHKSLLIATALLVALSIILLINRQETEPKGEPQRYTISSRDNPRFKEVYLDPFEFKPEQEQIVLVKIENPTPINSVTATIKTDNQINNFKMKLASGSATKGTWWGNWKIKDSINHTYRETFVAEAGSDKSQIDLTFK